MRHSMTCPKCQSADIVRVPGVIVDFGHIPTGVGMDAASVKRTIYVCAACGLSEDWIEAAKDLAAVTRKYGIQVRPDIRFVRPRTLPQAPAGALAAMSRWLSRLARRAEPNARAHSH